MSDREPRVFQGDNRAALEAALPEYILERRWFGGKARRVTSVKLLEVIPLVSQAAVSYIALAQVNYSQGAPQNYVLPLGIASGQGVNEISGAKVTDLEVSDPTGPNATVTVYDATFDSAFTLGLLDAIRDQKTIEAGASELAAWRTPVFAQLDTGDENLEPHVMAAEQSNTSIRYGERFILKLFRRLEEGTSPELEFGRFLGEKGFKNTPPLAGAMEYRADGREPLTLAILQGFARNQGDAWSYTLRSLEGYFERAAASSQDPAKLMPPAAHLLDLVAPPVPAEVQQLVGDYIGSALLLGQRTAQMHLALSQGHDDKAFRPEPYSLDYQQSLFRSMNDLTGQAFDLLRGKMDDLPEPARTEASALLNKQSQVSSRFEPFTSREVSALRTRVHGDYHLGQVLYTGDDFMIIDFEGEPVRPLSERRQKHSPLKDVAGMLRSFHYAAYSGMFEYIAKQKVEDRARLDRLEKWAALWQIWVSVVYLNAYLSTTREAGVSPRSREDLRTVLDAHLLEKAVYELVYELNNRPDWVRIPLGGIAQLVR